MIYSLIVMFWAYNTNITNDTTIVQESCSRFERGRIMTAQLCIQLHCFEVYRNGINHFNTHKHMHTHEIVRQNFEFMSLSDFEIEHLDVKLFGITLKTVIVNLTIANNSIYKRIKY